MKGNGVEKSTLLKWQSFLYPFMAKKKEVKMNILFKSYLLFIS